MNKAKTDFDKPAKDFIFILTVFNEHMEQELYAENICFILNKLMPVVYNAAVIGVTRESNDAIGKFKKKSDKEALQRVPAYGGFVRIEFVLSFFSAFELGDLQTSRIV